jgi:hypothetical protein
MRGKVSLGCGEGVAGPGLSSMCIHSRINESRPVGGSHNRLNEPECVCATDSRHITDVLYLHIGVVRINVARIVLMPGITGQGAASCAELLLRNGYEVHGIKLRRPLFNTYSATQKEKQ